MINIELTDSQFATIRAAMIGWSTLMTSEGDEWLHPDIYQEVVEIIALLELYELERYHA